MTIAAGFKCHDGVVLCADTQETRRQIIKVRVPKLVAIPDSNVVGMTSKLLFSGAGEGPFIDKLIARAWEASQRANQTMPDVTAAIEKSIKDAHDEYGKIYQPGYLPEAHLIYGVWVANCGTKLFLSVGPVVNEVYSHECVGIGEVLARYIADRMFSPETMSTRTTEILSVYLLSEAKEYVDGCGGDSVVATLANGGQLHTVDADEVSWITTHLRGFEARSSSLSLRAADLNVPDEDFDRLVEIFLEDAKESRKVHKRLRQMAQEAGFQAIREAEKRDAEREAAPRRSASHKSEADP